ncbi:hypothetical protein M409DRAFT_30603 [Zasmidium cellare ATCC 36951]|uniref:F-box domain-containing protein n=1 Tax=Zasmidium cellare ATCC 36951 TaxID=1080233 RepID=A0A6A6BVS0_ZASCE|nr:uncharacterized protein M409DRAFT_30603 [Zasmidium cellare ATCC 36951]KAF2158897.1 hypothetical protein M409DRAFT_30603 [Zasmidium cellare ATCC 36951]
MANTSAESISVADEAHTPIESPTSPTVSSPPFQEQPPKLKGRQRFLAGLHRISSSPSIARLNNSRSRTYNGTGKGSISCISLNSANSVGGPSFGSSLTREFSTGYATPNSGANTPGIQIPMFDERARLRYVSGQDGKLSIGIPSDLRATPRTGMTPGIAEVDEDYFSRPVTKSRQARKDFNFWRDLPSELKMEVLSYLEPKEVVRCSSVSKVWHEMCFDGQLWSILDTSGFYQDVPGDTLVKIICSAGPFCRDLNLRGCVQLREKWIGKSGVTEACKNLENFSLEGCRIDRASIHNFLYSNNRLVHLNLSGLAGASDAGMRIIGLNCPKLEVLNVSWCNNVTTKGLKKVIQGAPSLKDLRAGEIRGWDDVDFMQDLFERNTLERLVLMNCDTLTDESLAVLIEGKDSEIDYISGRPIVPPRKFKHLDLTRCRGITDQSVKTFVNNIPDIEGLQLSKCRGIIDATLTELLPTTPMLTHLDLEELEELTNAVLQTLANSPCAKRLRHLSISYCENMGDVGMLSVLKTCTNLRSLEMDNTRVGDLVLVEAASMVRQRTARTTIQGAVQPGKPMFKPAIGLRLVAYDCQNVTWTGIREVLSRNADVHITTHTTQLPPLEKAPDSSADSSVENLASAPRIHIIRSSTFPTEVIQLKCFYTFQPTVEEHTKRVMRGDFTAARRLERKWAEFMIASEEATALGPRVRPRQRRMRDAQREHAEEEDIGAPGLGVGGGRRRRARSGGCAVM